MRSVSEQTINAKASTHMKLSDEGYLKLDTIAQSWILADANQIAAWTGRPVETVAGQPGVRFAAGQPPILEFSPVPGDWRPYDQLVLVLATDGGTVHPNLFIRLDSRTEGLDTDDTLNSGRGADIRFEGHWGEYRFPWENFLIFGQGELVFPVRSARISWHGETTVTIWIRELRLERRERAQGPRLTDAGLRAVMRDGLDGEGLLARLRRRERPLHPYQAPARAAKPDASLLATAEAVCRHHINGYDVGNPVNWRINPNGYLEWMHAFNRQGQWFNALVNAYFATGDTRFINKLDELWLNWLRANPEPDGHNGGGDPAWETLSVAVRVYGAWLRAFFLLLNDPNLRDSTRIEVLKSFHGHAEHLMAYQGHANNWLIVESRVLFMLGMLFPEFKSAGGWLAAGSARLEAELARQIFPDGADWELSPGYHMMACQGFLEPLELARLNAYPLPALFETRLPAAFEYIAGMTRPDGTLPSVNDSHGWRTQAGADFLKQGARLFNRPDLLAGLEGPFAGRSRAFPDAGFHILASGQGFDALWSLFDGGPPGASHCHDDALGVEFFAHGKAFIVDPGITGYMQDAWTEYYRQSHAHNTVLVNHCGQKWALAPHALRTASARDRVRTACTELAESVSAVYEAGNGDQPDGIAHRRTLLFIRGRCWLVFDEVSGVAAHTMEARFQFAPLRMQLDARRRIFRTLRQNLPNLELRPLKVGGRMRLSIATGKTAPVGGWVSDGEDLPAPQARIQLTRSAGETNSSLRLVTVVYPFAAGVGAGLAARLTRDRNDADRLSLRLRHADGTVHRIAFAWPDGAWDCALA